MPNNEITQSIACSGGLDVIHDPITMFNMSGYATTLVNFESAQTGGYRRIDGYAKAVATTPSGAATSILSVNRILEGLVVSQGTGVYYTTDYINWVAFGVTRGSQTRNIVQLYRHSATHIVVLLSNGTNQVLAIDVDGSTLASGTKTLSVLGTSSGCPQAGMWSTIYKERYVVTEGRTVYWSGRFTPTDFTTSSAGAVDVGDVITGVKAFRDILYIFCQNSIHTISNIDENPNRQQIAKNIGCISGWSIQEVNGDIVFLSRDGLRTIAGTTRIGDIELSAISHIIHPVIQAVSNAIDTYTISSVVIRNKNQYRLFYSNATNSIDQQEGVIGSVVGSPEGIRWEWSRTKGIEVSSISSEDDENVLERVYHGDFDGYVHTHMSGTSFDGRVVHAIYKTPDIAFGDVGIRKTLYSVKLSMKTEATTSLDMTIKYDFSDTSIHHPQTYSFSNVYPAAIYGTGIYGTSVYGANTLPILKMNVEGSGSSASFKFETNDTTSLYRINGFYVDTQQHGRID